MPRLWNSALVVRLRGIDSGVRYAALGSAWVSLAGLVTLILVITELTPVEQGYFFSFSSLLLVQQFMELGFGIVLVQFVSHEATFLDVSSASLAGPERHRARLASLVRLALKWYSAVAIFFIVLLGPGGYAFFSTHGSDGVDWVGPWFLVVIAAGACVMMIPFAGFLEGSKQVGTSQRLMLIGNVAGAIAAWIALLNGFGLYALVFQLAVRAAVSVPLLARASRPFLALSKVRLPGDDFHWRREFVPQQWRISVSWLAGFTMFQMFAPITFQVRGPVAAGQIGSVVQVFHAVNLLASSWLIGVQPQFGERGARRDMRGLLVLVHRTLRRAVASAAVLAAIVFAGFVALGEIDPARLDRFDSLTTIALFLCTAIVLQPSNVWTAAIRFQKREPFVAIAVVSSLLVVASTAVLGDIYGPVGIAAGFLATMALVLTPVVYLIYRREIDSHRERFANELERSTAR